MKDVAFIVAQAAWGLPQTLAGAVAAAAHRSRPRFWFRGSVVTTWENAKGLSLGLFVFLPGPGELFGDGNLFDAGRLPENTPPCQGEPSGQVDSPCQGKAPGQVGSPCMDDSPDTTRGSIDAVASLTEVANAGDNCACGVTARGNRRRVVETAQEAACLFGVDPKLLVHEYGHCVQSLILGPLYLPLVGIPSLIWSNVPALGRMRGRRRMSYYAFPVERSANWLGERILDEPSVGLPVE